MGCMKVHHVAEDLLYCRGGSLLSFPEEVVQPSGKNGLDQFAVHVGESHVATAKSERQTLVVDT